MNKGRYLTWLHISDIHFLQRKEWRDSVSRQTLLDFLSREFQTKPELRPDLIFCTGDIAFGVEKSNTLHQQYEQAKTFFESLLNACGTTTPLQKEHLFVVPGNHDVDRNVINKDAQASLEAWAKQSSQHFEEINQRFSDKTPEFVDAARRLKVYDDFILSFLPHQHDPDGRSFYAKTLDIRGTNIGIAGFNSAWTCAGNEDDRNIWMASEVQLNEAYKSIQGSNIKIGLIHHPTDWLNQSDRHMLTRRIASDFTIWLHGHSHNAWVTPLQSHIIIAAGAIGAEQNDEFGINITRLNLETSTGTVYLKQKRSGATDWTIAPIEHHAPNGEWSFSLPFGLGRSNQLTAAKSSADSLSNSPVEGLRERLFDRRLKDALQTFPNLPVIWITPTISTAPETNRDANPEKKIDLNTILQSGNSAIIKAPPQYGLTCLSHYFIKKAWADQHVLFIRLDARSMRANKASIDSAVAEELKYTDSNAEEIKAVILDSWIAHEKDAFKLLEKVCERFKDTPVICMQQTDTGVFNVEDSSVINRDFVTYFVWSLSKPQIRQIVTSYNESNYIGDANAVTSRLISDLETLNLHRTPLNCLTLLKVQEVDFDDAPINRSEIVKRILFLIFNEEKVPTYASVPDVKDCEYVLGYFCEKLFREANYLFSRDRFLRELQTCCRERLIDLETHLVFDVLFTNNIITGANGYFSFKFAYWVFYFLAQRMHHDEEFARYMFQDMRYAQHPEIVEFYTGIDRRREDALRQLADDLQACRVNVKERCGLPNQFNPYTIAVWEASENAKQQMQSEILQGVTNSNLPEEIKDSYSDRGYNPARAYDQTIRCVLNDFSVSGLFQTMRGCSRALRNSDYVSPEIKRRLLAEIFETLDVMTTVLLIIAPILVDKGQAVYDGTGFRLVGDFGSTPIERFETLLKEIPSNVISWCAEDIYSRKMGPLLFDQINRQSISDISKYELMLLIIQKRPKEWQKHIKVYIGECRKNSFYLMGIYGALRSEYQFSYASHHSLREMEKLIKVCMTKHLTGAKQPSEKEIKKVRFGVGFLPSRGDDVG